MNTGFLRGSAIRAEFSDVLDTLRRGSVAEAEPAAAPREVAPDPMAQTSFDPQALGGMSEHGRVPGAPVTAGVLTALYAEAVVEASWEEPAVSSFPPSLFEPAEAFAEICTPTALLARELRLKPGLTLAELRRIRRAFALENHPDRLDPSRREQATRRMSLANILIDEALQQANAALRPDDRT